MSAATTEPSVTGPLAPGANIFGTPLTIETPVGAPDSNSAYRNLAGQPQRSGEAMLNWRRDRD
jgi:hypothetical protein